MKGKSKDRKHRVSIHWYVTSDQLVLLRRGMRGWHYRTVGEYLKFMIYAKLPAFKEFFEEGK